MKQSAILGCLIIFLAQTMVAGPTNSPASKDAPKQNDYQKFLKETEKLPPDQKKSKIKDFQESHGLTEQDIKKHQAEFRELTPEKRQARLQNRFAELKKKKAAGTLTTAEQEQLKNLEQWSKKNQQAAVKASSSSNTSTNRQQKTK